MFLSGLFEKFFGKKSDVENSDGGGADLELSAEDLGKLKLVDPKVVVGKILDIKPHSDPKITKVRVTQCDIGDGAQTQILCGGTNIEVEQIVPIATLGAKLSEDFTIGEREIRGEKSLGMICAKGELGLSKEGELEGGIWVLPKGLENKLGTAICKL